MKKTPSVKKPQIDHSFKGIFITPFVAIAKALLPYSHAGRSIEKYPKIKNINSESLSVCFKAYDEANRRIDKLENKSFKLLSYVTLLTTFLGFLFNYFFDETKISILNQSEKILLCSILILLVVSIFLSIKALKTKGKETLCMNDVFGIKNDEEYSEVKNNLEIDLNKVGMELLIQSSANIATGTRIAEILKAVELLIFISILLTSFFVYIQIDKFL